MTLFARPGVCSIINVPYGGIVVSKNNDPLDNIIALVFALNTLTRTNYLLLAASPPGLTKAFACPLHHQ